MHFHTRALCHIRPALSDCMATTLATSLVQSRLDYANSLLTGTSAANIHKLQCTQNSLSRVVLSGRHRKHLSASMRFSNLHWLPVRKRIDFKLALTTYNFISTHQSAYLRSLLFLYEPTQALRSSSKQLLRFSKAHCTVTMLAYAESQRNATAASVVSTTAGRHWRWLRPVAGRHVTQVGASGANQTNMAHRSPR